MVEFLANRPISVSLAFCACLLFTPNYGTIYCTNTCPVVANSYRLSQRYLRGIRSFETWSCIIEHVDSELSTQSSGLEKTRNIYFIDVGLIPKEDIAVYPLFSCEVLLSYSNWCMTHLQLIIWYFLKALNIQNKVFEMWYPVVWQLDINFPDDLSVYIQDDLRKKVIILGG
jgi:hypothetical protein